MKNQHEELADDHVIRVHDDPAAIDAASWNALVESLPGATPFLRHEMFAALHASGSATPRTGWTPCFVTLHRGDELVGACPAYLKAHSYGEYVFDWAWADAYERNGLSYYPKLLSAVPFTPVPGPRLIARDAAARRHVLSALKAIALRAQLSSAHVLFLDEADERAAQDAGWMLRTAVQFHWHNREPQPEAGSQSLRDSTPGTSATASGRPGADGYADFDDFLSTFRHDKRKKIHQERRKVQEAGVTFKAHEGPQITEELWSFFHRCYTLTYRAHHSTPYLTRDFFSRMAAAMPGHWVMFIAEQGGQPMAASLVAIDPARRAAFGRYWGATGYVPCLHFEACYYQPLQWCIERGYRRFEGGAQGEHKMARGLMPVRTASAHWLAHPEFARAVADFLEQEDAGMAAYVDELREHGPFRNAG